MYVWPPVPYFGTLVEALKIQEFGYNPNDQITTSQPVEE